MKRTLLPFVILLILLVSIKGFAQRRGTERIEETIKITSEKPLDVVINVDAGEIYVDKNSDEDEIQLTIRYSRRDVRAGYTFDEKSNELNIFMKMKGLHVHNKNNHVFAEVEVLLPPKIETEFYAKLKAGEMNLNMGGISLTEFSISNWAGEVDINYDEPNPLEIVYLDIVSKIGELRVSQLGNARFKKANINAGVGEIDIDFSGDLIPESMAKVDLDIGEASIRLPWDKGVKLQVGGSWSFLSEKNIDGSMYKDGRSYFSDNYDDEEEKFYVRITPGLGELTVDR